MDYILNILPGGADRTAGLGYLCEVAYLRSCLCGPTGAQHVTNPDTDRYGDSGSDCDSHADAGAPIGNDTTGGAIVSNAAGVYRHNRCSLAEERSDQLQCSSGDQRKGF